MNPHSDPEAFPANKLRREKNIFSGLLEILFWLAEKPKAFWSQFQNAVYVNRIPGKNNVFALFPFINFRPVTIPPAIIPTTSSSAPDSASNRAAASAAMPLTAASPVSLRGVSGRSI